jgi:hypothetical protein
MVIQFKRGTAERWEELNPVLEVGEPGLVIGGDKLKLKIGDGVTAWNDLDYYGEDNVVNAQTHYEFPSIGKPNTIYKAESEQKIYQWNTTLLKYEVLSSGESSTPGDLNITLINGGNANG